MRWVGEGGVLSKVLRWYGCYISEGLCKPLKKRKPDKGQSNKMGIYLVFSKSQKKFFT